MAVDPEYIVAGFGGLATIAAYITRQIWLKRKNGNNGNGGNGNGEGTRIARHCVDHDEMVRLLTECEVHIKWLRREQEQDNTKDLMSEILTELRNGNYRQKRPFER